MRTLIFYFLAAVAGAAIDIPGQADTIGHAIQTATATPNSVLTLSADRNEAVTFGANNTSLTLDLQGHALYNNFTTTGTGFIRITDGLATPLTIKNGSVSYTGTTASVNLLHWVTLNAGSPSVYISNVTFIMGVSFNTNNSQLISVPVTLAHANSFVLDSCSFMNDVGVLNIYGVVPCSPQSVNDASLIKNCFFSGMNNGALEYATAVGIGQCTDLYNSTIYNCKCGVYSSFAVTINGINNLILGSKSSDFINASPVSFTFSGFGKLASGGGTGCIYGLNVNTELCSQSEGYISPASTTHGRGISITGITESVLGLNGILHGANGGLEDMGCMPYSAALCGGYNCGK